jgi:hypothetical protein
MVKHIETSAGDVIGQTMEGKIMRLYAAELTSNGPPPCRLFDEGHVTVRAPAVHRVLATRTVQLHGLRFAKCEIKNILAISGRTSCIMRQLVNH